MIALMILKAILTLLQAKSKKINFKIKTLRIKDIEKIAKT